MNASSQDNGRQNADHPVSGPDKPLTTASKTWSDARHKAADTAQRTVGAIEANPLTVLVGGVALGALAGALVPRSAREKQILAPLGIKLGETARQAFAAAREAGKQELDNAGLTPSAAKERGKSLLDGVGKALSSAGSAAADSARTTAAPSAGDT